MIFILAIITSFTVAIMLIPSLIRMARARNIFDEPGERKLHTMPIPLLGGVAIFSGTLISFLFLSGNYFVAQQLFMIVSLLVLFITGFVDDLQPLKPKAKLSLQVVAASITVLFSGIRLTGLHGFLGFHGIHEFASIILSVLFILVIVNAFNFIDGVDGLAASLGILASAFFGVALFSAQDHLYAVLSFSLCGSLTAFFFFNFPPARIFMGDTGTLIIGFILALLTIRLTEVVKENMPAIEWLNYNSAPVFSLAVLIVPLVDFARVTIIRLRKGLSPIKADQNHIHHVLVQLGLNHVQVVTLLSFTTLTFVTAAFFLSKYNQSVVFFLIAIAGIILSQVPAFIIARKKIQI